MAVVFGAPAFIRENARESAFYRAMKLLVVMSPCALVLPVPSAILSAIAFGTAHEGGTVIVVLNSLRLLFSPRGTQ